MATRVAGTVAAIGYAAGPLFMLDAERPPYVPSTDPAIEAERLRSAIAGAIARISDIAANADSDAAAILEFQMAMLEDESLVEPALAAIAAGEAATVAWAAALDEQVAGYEAADDEYFRARSADILDIRDRVLGQLAGADDMQAPAGAVLHAGDITPTQFLSMPWRQGGGIVLREGSVASHVAMLARARGVPMLVGTGPLAAGGGDLVLLDAQRGEVLLSPDADDHRRFDAAATAHRTALAHARAHAHEAARTSDGERVEVLVNIADPADIDTIDIATCDGVGLMRTEFLYSHGLPDEETQLSAYRRVLAWAKGKPVTIRTVDAGGDKPVPGFTVSESNPFLGLRGIRLALAKPDIFRVQVRALLRAAPEGKLKVMFPMIGVIEEYQAARALFAEEAAKLGLPMPPLGIMVEVPAVAIFPQPFAGVAFCSIGSNDLTQYVMAAGRDNGAVAALNDPRNPAVLALIANVVDFGRKNDIPVSLCGDAGGDPALIPDLLAAGLRALSVTPAQLPLAKMAIARTVMRHAES